MFPVFMIMFVFHSGVPLLFKTNIKIIIVIVYISCQMFIAEFK